MLPNWLLIVLVFVIGTTVGALVGSATSGGCDLLSSSADLTTDDDNSSSQARNETDNGDEAGDDSAQPDEPADQGGNEQPSDPGQADNVDDGNGDQPDADSPGDGPDETPTDPVPTNPVDPEPTDPPVDPVPLILGTFASDAVQRHTEIRGSLSDDIDETESLSLTFDDAGHPTNLLVLAYSPAIDFVTTVNETGEHETLTGSNGTFPQISTEVTVTSADYAVSPAHIVLALNFQASSGQLMLTGTGVQTVDLTLSGDSLMYRSSVRYDVNWSGAVPFHFIETTVQTGTLVRQ